MEVRKIMTKNPACCTSDSTLQEVAHMMEMYDCGCIPVVESHNNNKPIGTITDRDIAVRAFAAGSNPLEMKASDIMTSDVATITPEASVEHCRDVMENRQIRRILVVDKTGRCVGIVAQADVVQADSSPSQTAEFMRDISAPSQSSQNSMSSDRSYFQSSPESYSGRDSMASERRSYENFSNQNRGYEFNQNRNRDVDFSREDNRRSQSFSRQGKRFKKSREKESSFFSLGTLLPLALAIGAGAALKYYLPVDKKSQTTFVPRREVTSSVQTTEKTTPKVSIELPTETNLGMRNSRDMSAGNVTSSTLDATDTDTNSEIGRTARL